LEKIVDIIEAMANEKSLSLDVALDAFREALNTTAKKCISPSANFDIRIDVDKKNYKIEQIIEVVENDDKRLDDSPDSCVSLEEAHELYDDNLEIGDEIRKEFFLEEHGRTASYNLYNTLQYQIQKRVEQDLFAKYQELLGTVIIGVVNRIDDDENTFVEIGEIKGVLSQRNRIKGESFKVGDTIKALLRYVGMTPEFGMSLELTRTAPKFLEQLMSKEVPEIAEGTVSIVSSARIPGMRAKLALKSDFSNIDPIGAAVGVKGMRINAVSRELKNENIDCVEYSAVPEIFINRSLAPAIVQSVKIEGKKAIVSITLDQKAKAIGKSGINIRLASMLTGYAIELKEIAGSNKNVEISSNNRDKSMGIEAFEGLFK